MPKFTIEITKWLGRNHRGDDYWLGETYKGERVFVHAYKEVKSKSTLTEYSIWLGMKQRCGNVNCKEYRYYGGRGIKVCYEWLHSFDTFLSDMGGRPSLAHSIDRINNDGNYEPSNCRWATSLQQTGNKGSI